MVLWKEKAFSFSIVPSILNIPVSFTCLQSRTDVGVAEQLRHLINKKCNWTKRKLTAKFTEEKDQAKKYIHFIERFHLWSCMWFPQTKIKICLYQGFMNNVSKAQMLPPCSWRPGWVLLMTTPRWLCCCWSGCGLPNRTNNILHISALYQHNQHQPTPVILHNSWKLSHQRGAKQESKVSRTIFSF